VIAKLFAGKEVPKELNFEEFRLFFATALERQNVLLTQSLAVDALDLSRSTSQHNN
jgi:hypothetical protein